MVAVGSGSSDGDGMLVEMIGLERPVEFLGARWMSRWECLLLDLYSPI